MKLHALSDGFAIKTFQTITAIGEEGFELVVGLLVMILVEHRYGTSGLGIFAFLMAAMYAVRYLSLFGIARHVEIDIASMASEEESGNLISKGLQAVLITSITGSIVLLVIAGFGSSHTQVSEQIVAYVLVAALIPFANCNSLKFAILNGQGKHGQVARLRMIRYGVILFAIFFLTNIHPPPSFLLAAYLLAEIYTANRLRKIYQFPKKLRTVLRHPAQTFFTLREGREHLFTDNGLDLILNIDLFILGLFVNDWQLGIYAEAAILVRLCLIISVGIKPILRRHYSLMVRENKIVQLIDTIGFHGSALFSIQGCMALLTLLYYPGILDFFFDIRGEASVSLHIFLIFVPGLIFFNTFSALEPVYEAIRRVSSLRKLTLTVTIINILLTSLLVPAAGIEGAAIATMLTMVAHFFLFNALLPFAIEPKKTTFLAAGLALYLLYLLLNNIGDHPLLYFWIAPLLLLVLFYGCGLFGIRAESGKELIA
jgi:O-antigen/teichoic acid export membrane protein